MPFVSEAQRRWMHANEPEMAERWERHTPKGKKLPKRKNSQSSTSKEAFDMSLTAIAQMAKQAAYRDAGLGNHQLLTKVASDAGYQAADFYALAEFTGQDPFNLAKFASDNPQGFFEWMDKEAANRGNSIDWGSFDEDADYTSQRKAKPKAGTQGRAERARQPQGKGQPTQVRAGGSAPSAKKPGGGTVDVRAARQAAQGSRQAALAGGGSGSGGPPMGGGGGAGGGSAGGPLARRPQGGALANIPGQKPDWAGVKSKRWTDPTWWKHLFGQASGRAGKVMPKSRLGRIALGLGAAGTAGAGALGLSQLGGGGGSPAADATAPARGAIAGAAPGAAGAGLEAASQKPAMAGLGLPGGGGGVLNWIKANPGKAGLLGLLGAGGGYGLYSLMGGGGDEEKEGSDQFGPWRPRNRKELIKRAAEVRRHNATIILNRYMDKLAMDAEPMEKRAYRTIQASLIQGDNINTAFKKAFPKMAAERRVMMASKIVKKALDSFVKQAMANCTTKSYTGKPQDGVRWMHENS